jgi:hypothetical protein
LSTAFFSPPINDDDDAATIIISRKQEMTFAKSATMGQQRDDYDNTELIYEAVGVTAGILTILLISYQLCQRRRREQGQCRCGTRRDYDCKGW